MQGHPDPGKKDDIVQSLLKLLPFYFDWQLYFNCSLPSIYLPIFLHESSILEGNLQKEGIQDITSL